MYGQSVFPPELYRMIIEHLDPNETTSLLSLLLSSRVLALEAERILYRSVSIEVCSSAKAGSNHRFFSTITACARRARLVHSLNCTTPRLLYEIHSSNFNQQYYKRCSAALRVLVNLRNLSCQIPSIPPPPPDCEFQLTELQWDSFPDERDLIPFLARQKHLKKISIGVWRSLDPLPPELCPNLRILAGPPPLMLAFLPGHAITHLAVTGLFFARSAALPGFAPALENLRALRLHIDVGVHMLLTPLVPHLKRLQYLQIAIGYSVTAVSAPIKGISALRGLTLVGGLWSEFERNAAHALFDALPGLDFMESSAFRWERGVPTKRALGVFHDWLADVP